MHFKGKPETPGPLALFPLTAQAPASLPGLRGSGGRVDAVRVDRGSPQLLLLTPVGDLPRIPMTIMSPEMGSAPQLEDSMQYLGKRLAKQQLTGAHQSPLLIPFPPNSAPPPQSAIPTRFARTRWRREVLRNGSQVKHFTKQLLCVAFLRPFILGAEPGHTATFLGSEPGALQHF